jgi:hypothetical protein
MRINIFDNGLSSRTGHHFDFCLRLARALTRRGHAVGVFGARDAEPGLFEAIAAAGASCQGLFSYCSHTPLDLGSDPYPGLEAIARTAAREMSGAPPAQLNLFPTLTPLEFLAYSHSDIVAPLVGMAHGDPTFQRAFAGRAWATAAGNVRRRGLPFRLGAIDPVIADYLRTYLGGMPVAPFPIVQDGARKQHYGAAVRRIGFFGAQREERGLALIPTLTEHLLALGYQVVLHDTQGQFHSNPAPPNLRLVRAFVADLHDEMTQCDVVVCPMRRENYVHRISGVVCDAVSGGIPFVLPAGTLSAARFHPLGSSVCYHEQSLEGVLQAIATLAAHYPTHAAAAGRAALQWPEQHGVERFVDTVLQTAS